MFSGKLIVFSQATYLGLQSEMLLFKSTLPGNKLANLVQIGHLRQNGEMV